MRFLRNYRPQLIGRLPVLCYCFCFISQVLITISIHDTLLEELVLKHRHGDRRRTVAEPKLINFLRSRARPTCNYFMDLALQTRFQRQMNPLANARAKEYSFNIDYSLLLVSFIMPVWLGLGGTLAGERLFVHCCATGAGVLQKPRPCKAAPDNLQHHFHQNGQQTARRSARDRAISGFELGRCECTAAAACWKIMRR